MQAETGEILRRVISKAEKLRESGYARQLETSGYRIEFRQQGIHVTKPDDEARDAFILTLRFFTLGNERTSFCRLAALLDAPDVSQEWKDSFAALNSAFNDFLATAYGEYQYDGQPHRFTNREILDTFLYGGLVHANKEKTVARYEEWTRHPGIYEMLEFWFVSTVRTLLRAISLLALICEREMGQTSGLAGGAASAADGSGPRSG